MRTHFIVQHVSFVIRLNMFRPSVSTTLDYALTDLLDCILPLTYGLVTINFFMHHNLSIITKSDFLKPSSWLLDHIITPFDHIVRSSQYNNQLTNYILHPLVLYYWPVISSQSSSDLGFLLLYFSLFPS